jgi:hypothetical protein
MTISAPQDGKTPRSPGETAISDETMDHLLCFRLNMNACVAFPATHIRTLILGHGFRNRLKKFFGNLSELPRAAPRTVTP